MAGELVSMLDLGLESFIDALECSHFASDTLFESSDAIAAACLGVAGGILLTRFLLKRPPPVILDEGLVIRSIPEHVPPLSWKLVANEKTIEDVSAIITACFRMASKAPKHSRDQAYREASFQVPHELARLSPDAPSFRVEDMGPLSSLRKTRQELESEGRLHIDSPFNMEKDARVFLYFLNDSTQATAAFLAINAEFAPLEQVPTQGINEFDLTEDQLRLLGVAMKIWFCQNVDWVRRHDDVLHRIGPTDLPVIFSFRGNACGSLWESYSASFPYPRFAQIMMSFYQKD
ncbi:hypothetical protein Daus18300_003006 [Diaporthe australafricana]|uniref:Uncharacterized protein n=1 Tax=Diaporthe australafricana TaxID=127596 RepID=A0ABR3XIN8_9PEZI